MAGAFKNNNETFPNYSVMVKRLGYFDVPETWYDIESVYLPNEMYENGNHRDFGIILVSHKIRINNEHHGPTKPRD